MSLFQLDLEKNFRGEYFSNRYILNLPAITAGFDVMEAIAEIEQDVLIPDVTITKARISDFVVGNDQFVVYPLSIIGSRTILTDALPLFCCARADFSTGVGRPSRKYMRGVLAEGDQSNYGVLSDTFVAFFNSTYVTPLLGVEEYVDVDGQLLVSGATHPQVQMRQLRRGNRRRPIIG